MARLVKICPCAAQERSQRRQGYCGFSYVHNAIADGLGKIGVLVALESDGDAGKLEEIGKQIAMHVAATSPLSLNKDELDPDGGEQGTSGSR